MTSFGNRVFADVTTLWCGHSGLEWVLIKKKKKKKETCPELELLINGHKFVGILDTGADVSVISLNDWPKNWNKQVAISTL